MGCIVSVSPTLDPFYSFATHFIVIQINVICMFFLWDKFIEEVRYADIKYRQQLWEIIPIFS